MIVATHRNEALKVGRRAGDDGGDGRGQVVRGGGHHCLYSTKSSRLCRRLLYNMNVASLVTSTMGYKYSSKLLYGKTVLEGLVKVRTAM